MSEKAKYRVLRLSHIHNKLWEPGEEVEYDGKPGSALEPLNDAAIAAKNAATGQKLPVDGLGTGGEMKKPGEEVNDDLADLQQQYEELFGKKPHPASKAETLREKIAEERSRLGV
ncbi:hypothetical protein [Pectobacterium versatile]|uniref:hypothetical protein n=1 Tax=Pectobacterium versatile TaxID=2488639 RepID=UPI00102E7C40|nr:hypothetical protein [Pectobacterium versatile]TAI99811.1 hypothetical protein EG332_04170 [Pectobacterium versatile]UEQ10463.1 hypothetical protein LLE50_04955 [Pectobacterium versatile]